MCNFEGNNWKMTMNFAEGCLQPIFHHSIHLQGYTSGGLNGNVSKCIQPLNEQGSRCELVHIRFSNSNVCCSATVINWTATSCSYGKTVKSQQKLRKGRLKRTVQTHCQKKLRPRGWWQRCERNKKCDGSKYKQPYSGFSVSLVLTILPLVCGTE